MVMTTIIPPTRMATSDTAHTAVFIISNPWFILPILDRDEEVVNSSGYCSCIAVASSPESVPFDALTRIYETSPVLLVRF
jgi:hypothetical protein